MIIKNSVAVGMCCTIALLLCNGIASAGQGHSVATLTGRQADVAIQATAQLLATVSSENLRQRSLTISSSDGAQYTAVFRDQSGEKSFGVSEAQTNQATSGSLTIPGDYALALLLSFKHYASTVSDGRAHLLAMKKVSVLYQNDSSSPWVIVGLFDVEATPRPVVAGKPITLECNKQRTYVVNLQAGTVGDAKPVC